MSGNVVLENASCRLAAAPSGEVTFTAGENALRLGAGDRDSVETRITRSDRALHIESSRGGFRLRRTLSPADGKRPCVLHVTCTVTAERRGPLHGLLDHWSSNINQPHDYRWAPNLRPGDGMRIGSHCFRSPVVMVSGATGWAALIPDFSSAATRRDAHLCSLDLDGGSSGPIRLGFGIEPTRPAGHVLFEVELSVGAKEGDTFSFEYSLVLGSTGGRKEALRAVNAFLWSHNASPYLADRLPQTVPFDRYAEYAYPSLLTSPPFVRFELDGRPAGGVSAEPAHAEYFRRPHPVVWNQYWFNNQRAAYGLGVYGKAKGNSTFLESARLMTATTLGAPRWGGLWPAIYAYDANVWWGSIPRLNGGKRRIHVADAAQTGEWLLRWEKDVESTGRGLPRIRSLAGCLCHLQEDDGSIPPWFDWDGAVLHPVEVLCRSAETGAATAFLGEVGQHLFDEAAGTALMRGAEFLRSFVMNDQRYQDFETFFSCSPKDLDMVDSFTGIRPQNSLAVFWTARTMLHAYRLSGADEWLQAAVEVTDSLSLYQQVWNPPFLSLYAFGGFGVMNTDAEWNDARQSLFAPHYFDMFEATGLEEYLQRGRAAMRASFALASIPENERISPNTFDTYPPGLMPENYGHAGRDVPAGRSDACWGEAGALTSVAWIRLGHPGLLDDIDDNC